MGNLTIWLTPLWVLSLGVTAAAAIMLVLFGITWLISRRSAEAALRLERESILQWVSYLVLVLVGFCLLASPVMPVRQITNSLKRLTVVGPTTAKITVPAHTDDMEVPVNFESDELQSYSFASDQDLVVGVEKGKAYSNPMILVEGNENYDWTPSSKTQRLFTGQVSK